MNRKYALPQDCPAHCCGRCFYWRPLNDKGQGVCYIAADRRRYKCNPCTDYEYDISNFGL